MKTASAGLLAELATQGRTRIATCWKLTLVNGTIKTFTSFDKNLTISFLRYVAASGYTPTDVQSGDTLSVDNLEVTGVLESPSITPEELRSGIWDFAYIEIFIVNYAVLSQGRILVRVGNLGEVRTGRGQFEAEIRGLMQAYSRSRGELTSPSCRYELYDERCKVDPAPWTVTGTLEGVGEDQMTLFDSARTEGGVGGSRVITGISNANPGVVTMAVGSPAAAAFLEGQPITLSDIGGMPLLNVQTFVNNPTDTTFELSIDTSDTAAYGTYSGGGIVTPLGAESGYFDHGVITILDGDNAGFSMEVKYSVPGMWIIQLPFPYPLLGTEAYTMKAGCNKEFFTGCRDKFTNSANFGGEPWLRGLDQLVQVGRK